MCHGHHSSDRLKAEIARELLEELDVESAAAEPAGDDLPSFLNEEREAEIDVLTDGGASPEPSADGRSADDVGE